MLIRLFHFPRRLHHARRLIAFLAIATLILGIGLYRHAQEAPQRANLSPQHKKYNDLVSLATVQRNVPYCQTNNRYQTLNFYRPKNTGDKVLPLLVYIHGGGWRSGDKGKSFMLNTYGGLFIQHNVAIASIDYRLKTAHPYPDQNNDIACALNYLEDHASVLGIDPKKTIYFGESAGGQLAAFAALNIPYQHYDYDAPIGVIDFYGVSNFSTIVIGKNPDMNARRYLGSKYNSVATVASPISYITKKAPRFLIIHGAKDKVVPMAQSTELYRQLVAQGVEANYITLPDAKHGFTGPELSPHDYHIIQTNLTEFIIETLHQ